MENLVIHQPHKENLTTSYISLHVSWSMHADKSCGPELIWVGLGWAGLGWAGLGWAGLGWAGLGWAGLGWAGLGLHNVILVALAWLVPSSFLSISLFQWSLSLSHQAQSCSLNTILVVNIVWLIWCTGGFIFGDNKCLIPSVGPIVAFHLYCNVNVREGTRYSLCTGDVPPPRVRFSWSLSGKGVVFSPNNLARGLFW